MQSPTDRVRADALHVLTIATFMVGFGLLSTSFQPEAERLWALLRGGAWALRDYGAGDLLGLGLSVLKIVFGLLIVGHHIGMIEHMRRLFLRDGLSSQDLAERTKSPFRKLLRLAVLTFWLFLFQQISDIASLQ